MSDQSRLVQPPQLQGAPVLPTETRFLLDVWLVLSIAAMLVGMALGIRFVGALNDTAERLDPGPAPTATSMCVEGRDAYTGEPC